LIKKNIYNFSFIILLIVTLTIFLQNFYNEIFLKYLNNPNFFKVFFSDFYLIYAGSEILNQGNNPYETWIKLHNSPFFNPPIVFYFFKYLTNFDYLTVIKFWFLFLMLSFALIPIILFKIFEINLKKSFIFIFCFGGISLSVFFTGNLSIFLTTLFAISLFFLNKSKDHYFYLILSFLSLIKFPYLIFFGLPFLINKLKKEVFINSFLYISSIIFIYLIFFYFNNELFFSWIDSLKFSKNIGDQGDFGRGLFKIINSYFFNIQYLNYIIYFLITGSLFIFLIFLFKNSKILTKKVNKNLAIALGIIALSICLPRLKSYDILIIIPCLFFVIESLKFKLPKLNNFFIKLFLFLTLFCWTSPYAPILLCIIIVIIFSIDLKYNFIEKK